MLMRSGLHTGGCRAWRRAQVSRAAKGRARRARQLISLAASVSMSLSAASMASMDEAGTWPGPATADVHMQAEQVSELLGEPADKVLRVLNRYAVASAISPSQLAASTLSLSNTLQINAMTALLMVLKRPLLLQQPAQGIRAQVADIASALNMELQDAAALLARQPLLLDFPTSTLIADMTRIASALDVPISGLLLVLSRTRPTTLQQLLSTDAQAIKSQVQELRSIIGSHFGPQQAAVTQLFITRCPDLLLSSCAEVENTLVALARLLQLPARRLLLLISKCPALLLMASTEILHNMRGALAALRINQGAVTDMCVTEPRLLQLEPQVLRARVDGMLFNLYLPRSQVIDMVVRQPTLLLYQTATLQAHMSALMRILSVQHEVVQSLLQLVPHLLLFSSETIQSKLLLLQRLFGLKPMHACQLVTHNPRLLVISNERLAQSREVLTQLLQIPVLNLPGMLLAHPSLLLATPNKARGKVRDLAALMALNESQEAEAGALLRANPAFLDEDPALWQTNFDTITSQLGLSISQTRQAIAAKPQLLSTDPKQLLQRCTTIGKLANGHPTWRARLDTAKGEQVLPCLLVYDFVLARLQWLAANGMQDKYSLLDAFVYDKAFERKHPQFREWLQQQGLGMKGKGQLSSGAKPTTVASESQHQPPMGQQQQQKWRQLQQQQSQDVMSDDDDTPQIDDQLVDQLMQSLSSDEGPQSTGWSQQAQAAPGQQRPRASGRKKRGPQVAPGIRSSPQPTPPAEVPRANEDTS